MNHMDKIAAQLPEYGLDAMLITSDSGERYALDFHGEGVLLIAREGARYITDGRYIEAARERVTGAEVCLATAEKGHMELAKEYIQGRALHNVGFESGAMTVDGEKKYAQELPCILTPAQKLLDGLRASKDPWEQDRIRQAQAITDESFRAILNFIRPGMTEQEIAARLVYEMLSRGAERTSFDPIVAAGANGSRPHAVPGARVVEEGMFITMDFGCKVGGYCSDMTRTVALGHPTQEMEEVYAAVLAAQKAGIQAARAGVPGSEIDAAARRMPAFSRPHRGSPSSVPQGSLSGRCPVKQQVSFFCIRSPSLFFRPGRYSTIRSLGERVMSSQPVSFRISTSSIRTPNRPGR